MKGYFGIGVEGISKAVNVGTLFRTAHAFGALLRVHAPRPVQPPRGAHTDTSDTPRSVPTYNFADLEAFRLPQGCRLVGIEITDQAIELPSFRHPRQAAYILGAEREGLSADVQSICDYVVKIPTRFSVNLGVAGALIMYDRQLSLGRHAAAAGGRGRPDRGRGGAAVRRADLQAKAAGSRTRSPGRSSDRQGRRAQPSSASWRSRPVCCT